MLIETYRRHWPRIGGVIAASLVAAVALAGDRLDPRRRFATLNFAALLAHQVEEYVWPGWFPGHLNGGVFHSDSPRTYPLNTNTAMVINTVIAYPVYIAPIVLPGRRAIGIGPVLFGMSQALAHGVIFPRRSGDRYSPGFVTAVLLHVPIGVAYLRAIARDEGGVSRGDLSRGFVLGTLVAAVAVLGPNSIGRDRESRHAFTARQMGPHARRDD